MESYSKQKKKFTSASETYFQNYVCIRKPAIWSGDNAFVSEAGGLRFKSYLVLPTALHRSDISKGAALTGRNDAEMSPADSLHASA